jgi:hypothetical protein
MKSKISALQDVGILQAKSHMSKIIYILNFSWSFMEILEGSIKMLEKCG